MDVSGQMETWKTSLLILVMDFSLRIRETQGLCLLMALALMSHGESDPSTL